MTGLPVYRLKIDFFFTSKMRLFIVGSGGFAKEVAWLIEEIAGIESGWELMGFVAAHVTTPYGRYPYLGADAWALANLPRDARFVVAIGNPALRSSLAKQYESAGFQPHTLVHPIAQVADRKQIGPGSILCAGAVVCPDARLGRHVILNLNSTVGHDAQIDDFVTVSPGVNISGNVQIGPQAEIGSGAVLIPGVRVGASTVLGAGAVAISDLDARSTYVGVPARKVKSD